MHVFSLIRPWAPLQGGTGGTRPTQYFNFLTLRPRALHGKNRLQAFVPLNIRRVAELLSMSKGRRLLGARECTQRRN